MITSVTDRSFLRDHFELDFQGLSGANLDRAIDAWYANDTDYLDNPAYSWSDEEVIQ